MKNEFIQNILRALEGAGSKCVLCGRRRYDLKICSDGVGICHSCYERQMKLRADEYYDAGGGISRLFAPFSYKGDLRRAILNMKFCGCRAYAPVLAMLVADALPEYYSFSDYDMLIPVPLHSKRLDERGYNQAELLAYGISERIGVPVADDVLFRVRETQRQMNLSKAMRIRNVSGAFFADAKSVAGKRIILADDIYTAGATMRACAAELADKGAAEIIGIVAAENFGREHPEKIRIKIPVINS